MSTLTTNYNLIKAEGTDKYNHLTIDNPNMDTIDGIMKDNEVAGVPSATELASGSVHAITRSKPDAAMFHFTATANFALGDTFTVDSVPVTALMPDGSTIPDAAYVIGCEILAVLVGTRMTVFIGSSNATLAEDSNKLGGNLPSYYGTYSDVVALQNAVSAITDILNPTYVDVVSDGIKTFKEILNELYQGMDDTIDKYKKLVYGSTKYFPMGSTSTFSNVSMSGQNCVVLAFYLHSTNSYLHKGTIGATYTYSDESLVVPAAGIHFRLMKQV